MSLVTIKTIPEGYKQTEIGIIPNSWDNMSLKSALKEPPKYGINAAAVPLQGDLPVYIRITDISEDGYFKPTEKVGVNSSLSNLYKLKSDDIVLARTGASVGKSYLYRESDGELVFAGFLIKVSPNTEMLNPEFLFQYFKTEQYWAWIIVNSMRSGQPGVNGNEFASLIIPLPKIEEQTAIANALSDVDALLTELQNLIAKKQAIKTATMQQLLTGKTRLPEFAYHQPTTATDDNIGNKDKGILEGKLKGTKPSELGEIPEDWEIASIAQKYTLATGTTPPTSNKKNYGGELLFVSPADLGRGKYILKTEKHLSKVGFRLARKYPAGSTLFTCIGSTIGKTGLARIELSSNQQINAVFPNESSDAEFTYYVLTYIAPKVKALAGHQAVPLVNKTEFGETLFCFPNDLGEQTAIATILSDMDNEIQTIEKRLTKTRQIKQGMMQELLTGKTRLV
jgi:type I restriction enzyme S subunit